MSHAKGLCLLLAMGSVSGCSTIPIASVLPLASINAETTSLSDLRVAVRLPEALRPRAGGVKLDVVLRIGGESERKVAFLLAESADPADLTGLADQRRTGFGLYAFRLAPTDIGGFESLRADAFAARKAGRAASLGMGVATRELCRAADLPGGPLLLTTYLKTSETRSYVTASENLDLRRPPNAESAVDLASLAPC